MKRLLEFSRPLFFKYAIHFYFREQYSENTLECQWRLLQIQDWSVLCICIWAGFWPGRICDLSSGIQLQLSVLKNHLVLNTSDASDLFILYEILLVAGIVVVLLQCSEHQPLIIPREQKNPMPLPPTKKKPAPKKPQTKQTLPPKSNILTKEIS